ncbi:uncharacterized protein RAG0_10107 [Rhynchosporium agropyri]|uniref:Uncharacterized protein n=1 Tax=Rhynchosporium agropyri TaxID=914238 RepID=A0A1E1KYG4_9HELO|nr:uncharacterized protein RAG0_10107 [Rhynchosporium agropyri]
MRLYPKATNLSNSRFDNVEQEVRPLNLLPPKSWDPYCLNANSKSVTAVMTKTAPAHRAHKQEANAHNTRFSGYPIREVNSFANPYTPSQSFASYLKQ